MTKKRPFGIILLAILIGIDALIAIYHTLQFLHILPFSLGPIRFFSFDLIGAVLWGINAAILIWVVYSLWNLRMEGRLFVLIFAVLNLILAFLSILGQSSFSAMLPAILINVIVLIYLLMPGVEKAFEPVNQPAAAPLVGVVSAPAAPPFEAAAIPVEERMVPVPEMVQAEEAPVEAVPAVMAAAAAEAMAGEPEAAVEAMVGEPEVAAEIMAPEPEMPAMAEPLLAPETAVAVTAELEEAPSPVAPVEEKGFDAPHPAPAPRPKVAIDTIEGIGPVYKAKLKEVGIEYVASLLELGASRKGREELAEQTSIAAALILKWVNMADLMRISGVGEEYSELLEAAGVDTVKELRNRNPENLLKAMLDANQQHAMVRRTPHLSEVESWVEQAKLLDPVITY